MEGKNISLLVLKLSNRKRKLSMMLELKQNKPIKEREWEDTAKGLGIWGLVEKVKGPVERAPR